MNTAFVDVGAALAVERDDDGQGPRPLAVGAVVVGVGVLDPIVAVRVDLCDARHPLGAQVATSLADGLRRHDVVLRPQERIGNDDGRCDVDLVVAGHVRVPALVDRKAVDVGDALDFRLVLSE